MYSTVKTQSVRDPDLGLEDIIGMVKTIFINHSERSSVPKRSKEPYSKVRRSGREPRTDNMHTVVNSNMHGLDMHPVVKSNRCSTSIGDTVTSSSSTALYNTYDETSDSPHDSAVQGSPLATPGHLLLSSAS